MYFIGAVVTARIMPTPFKADHPFVYFIRDTETNTIVFSGRVMNISS